MSSPGGAPPPPLTATTTKRDFSFPGFPPRLDSHQLVSCPPELPHSIRSPERLDAEVGLLRSGRAASFSPVVRERTWSQTTAEGASVLTGTPGNNFTTQHFFLANPLQIATQMQDSPRVVWVGALSTSQSLFHHGPRYSQALGLSLCHSLKSDGACGFPLVNVRSWHPLSTVGEAPAVSLWPPAAESSCTWTWRALVTGS